jgi:hypothetical protein
MNRKSESWRGGFSVRRLHPRGGTTPTIALQTGPKALQCLRTPSDAKSYTESTPSRSSILQPSSLKSRRLPSVEHVKEHHDAEGAKRIDE